MIFFVGAYVVRPFYFSKNTYSWEQRKLGEIGANFYGGGTPNTAIDNFWNGHLAWLQSSDISEFDVLHSNPKKFITLKGLQNSAAKKIPSKSIAIVTRVGVGKVLLVPFEYSTSQDFLSISELKIDELFAIYAISKLMNIEKDNVQGTSIKGITKNELLDKSIFIPKDKTEQTAIGNFFKQLDETIALHQREYEKYKNLKISYLEKMFPKENEQFPELRFPEFTDAWEQRKLGDYATIKGRLGWKSLKKDEYLNNGPCMIAGKHIKNGVIDWVNVDHIPEWRYYESPEIMLKDGDLIFSKDGSLGNPALISNLNVLATINSTMMLVRLNEQIDPKFFYQILCSKQFEDLIALKVSGSSIPHLFQADMKEFSFIAPNVKEQTAIGNFFKQLDETIALHQRQIEKYRLIKKLFLEKMFIK